MFNVKTKRRSLMAAPFRLFRPVSDVSRAGVLLDVLVDALPDEEPGVAPEQALPQEQDAVLAAAQELVFAEEQDVVAARASALGQDAVAEQAALQVWAAAVRAELPAWVHSDEPVVVELASILVLVASHSRVFALVVPASQLHC
jgi:hypothetical protein